MTLTVQCLDCGWRYATLAEAMEHARMHVVTRDARGRFLPKGRRHSARVLVEGGHDGSESNRYFDPAGPVWRGLYWET